MKAKDPLTFAEFQNVNRERCEDVFHLVNDWSPTDWACALAGEVGELCNLIKKLRRGDVVDMQDVADEMGDVVTYLALLAERLDIDLGGSTRLKFNVVSARKGSSIRLYEHRERG